MTMGSDKSLEDYEERFQLNYKRARCTLDPVSFAFGWRTKKSAGYSQESMETITSSTIPSGITVERSASYNTVVVFLKEPWRLSLSIVSFVITLMAAPRSIKVCGTIVPLMWTSTTGLPGSRYFGQIICPNIRSDSCPMKLMVGASLLCLPRCLKHFSLINLIDRHVFYGLEKWYLHT